jgi:von Willebrand factor A domain-containing protein 8
MEIAKFDGDDWFVIAISDANFGRYQITAAELKKAMNRDPKVRGRMLQLVGS